MADVVLTAALADAGLDDRVDVVSSGTGGMAPRRPDGPPGRGDPHRPRLRRLPAPGSKQFEASWHDEVDVVLAMDATNHSDLARAGLRAGRPGRLLMFRDLDPRATDDDRDVPDPYFGDDDGFSARHGDGRAHVRRDRPAAARRTGVTRRGHRLQPLLRCRWHP